MAANDIGNIRVAPAVNGKQLHEEQPRPGSTVRMNMCCEADCGGTQFHVPRPSEYVCAHCGQLQHLGNRGAHYFATRRWQPVLPAVAA